MNSSTRSTQTSKSSITSSKRWKLNSIEKHFKQEYFAVFGIYSYYKLSYISLVKSISKVADFIDQPVYEIKECEHFAISSKKFYKKNLGKKDVDIERSYKKLFRSYKTYKFFYLCYGYDISTNIQTQRITKLTLAEEGQENKELYSKKFTWNGDLSLFNQVFKYKEWLVPIIHGYVDTFNIDVIEGNLQAHFIASFTLISRRSRF